MAFNPVFVVAGETGTLSWHPGGGVSLLKKTHTFCYTPLVVVVVVD